MQRNGSSQRQVCLMNTFRELWVQHVMWTRSFIISTAEDLGDLDLVTKRLLRNPCDFANLLKSFYGEEKANKFQKLFEEHLLIAADLVNAAKAGNTRAADMARKKWYHNADQIVNFLAGINPCWSQREWKNMMYEHLHMTEKEATLRLNCKYADDIRIYDDIECQALKMADTMSQGIINQCRYQ